MVKDSIFDQKYEDIKRHILYPDKSELRPELQRVVDHTVAAAKILDKNPVQSKAVRLLQTQFEGEISRSQAWEAVKMAIRLFNTQYSFEYDFWHEWMLKDIVELISFCKGREAKIDENGNVLLPAIAPDRKAWAEALKVMQRSLGDRPETDLDPRLIEKHTYFIPIQINGDVKKLPIQDLEDSPKATLQELLKAMNQEITDVKAEEIMNS